MQGGWGEGILWVLLVAAVCICCYKAHIGSCQSVSAANGSLQVPMSSTQASTSKHRELSLHWQNQLCKEKNCFTWGHRGIAGCQGQGDIRGIAGCQGQGDIRGIAGCQGQGDIRGIAGCQGQGDIRGIAGCQGCGDIRGIAGCQGHGGVRGIAGCQGCGDIRDIVGVQKDNELCDVETAKANLDHAGRPKTTAVEMRVRGDPRR